MAFVKLYTQFRIVKMNIASLTRGVEYNENKPAITVLIDNDNTKEIRIAMRKGQFMKEHKTAFPIVVEIVDGDVDFSVNGVKNSLQKGDLVALEGNVPHDLFSTSDCIIRLSLSKLDNAQRVKDVAN
jgi:quercetin dioxygenase-like cupin family protein